MKKVIGFLAAMFLATGLSVMVSGVAGAATPQAKAGQTFSATTSITNHDDSGTEGNNWALDNFTRVATIKFVNQVSVSNCPGSDTGKCYFWTYTLKDNGTFTTVPNVDEPNSTTQLDLALTGPMTGGTSNGEFYTSWRNPSVSSVAKTVNGDGSMRESTTNWPEQFFGKSAVFNSVANPGGPDLGSTAGWTYTLNFGTDPQCIHEATQWVDAAASGWGTLKSDGNIHADNSSDCSV